MDSSLESLLITWTDPLALGAGAVALALLVFVAWRVRQTPAPKVDPAAARPQEAAPEPTDRRKMTPGKARTVAELVADEESDTTAVLSRFVLNTKGETVGETMGLSGENIILKHKGQFLLLSQEVVLEKDGMLLADANIDWDEARRLGDAWQAESRDEMKYDEEGMPVLDNKS